MIKKIGGWANLILLLIFIGFAVYGFLRKKSLTQNSNYTKGIVLGKSKGARGNIHLDYQFFVDEKGYKGFVPSGFCKKCSCCTIGDTVIVRYERENPKNNDLVTEIPSGEFIDQ